MKLNKKPYRGCRDFFPKDMKLRQYLSTKMQASAELFAFLPYDGPLLEEVELYKAKSGEELINDQIYAFYDRGERHVAIRPEMTPTLARMVAQVHKETPRPIRWYSIPNLMRYEKPQRGRLREHWQFNADIFGAPDNLAEIEILELVSTLLTSYGATEKMFAILINDRRIVEAVFNKLLKLEQDQSYRLYKVIDKAKKVSSSDLEKMISEVINSKEGRDLFQKYLALNSFAAAIEFLNSYKLNEDCAQAINLFKLLEQSSCAKYLAYDPTIVRGLDYYTGLVFEVFDLHPENKRAIAGGGAYANLLQIFGQDPLPGVGVGMGDVTLKDFLDVHNLLPDLSANDADLFLCYTTEDAFTFTSQIAAQLRSLQLRVDMHLGEMKFGKVFKTAEKKNHQFIVIIGEDEMTNNEILLKNLQTRESHQIKIDQLNQVKNIIKS